MKSLSLFIILLFSFVIHADVVTNLHSQSRVKILKVVEGFEKSIINDIRQGKVIESCMKIAEAYSASLELKIIKLKHTPLLEKHLWAAKNDCSGIDQIKVDELYLKQLSRHLSNAQKEFRRL